MKQPYYISHIYLYQFLNIIYVPIKGFIEKYLHFYTYDISNNVGSAREDSCREQITVNKLTDFYEFIFPPYKLQCDAFNQRCS